MYDGQDENPNPVVFINDSVIAEDDFADRFNLKFIGNGADFGKITKHVCVFS